MTPKEKAEELVNTFRMVLMNENTDCGNEILCTLISKQNALITVDEMLKLNALGYLDSIPYKYWNKVKQEIDKI